MCERCEWAENNVDDEDELDSVECMDVQRLCPHCGEYEAQIGPEGPNPESGDVLACNACGYEEPW